MVRDRACAGEVQLPGLRDDHPATCDIPCDGGYARPSPASDDPGKKYAIRGEPQARDWPSRPTQDLRTSVPHKPDHPKRHLSPAMGHSIRQSRKMPGKLKAARSINSFQDFDDGIATPVSGKYAANMRRMTVKCTMKFIVLSHDANER